jgi:hypothetical protein
MHSIVDSFPKIAALTRGKVPRAAETTDDQYKQLVGEEMIAYITGEMLAGTIELTGFVNGSYATTFCDALQQTPSTASGRTSAYSLWLLVHRILYAAVTAGASSTLMVVRLG